MRGRDLRKTDDDLVGGKRVSRLSSVTILEAEMDNHAEGQEISKTRQISVLDWPTPEMLAAAHRARAKALKEMVVALFRWLNGEPDETLPVAKPAKVRVASRR